MRPTLGLLTVFCLGELALGQCGHVFEGAGGVGTNGAVHAVANWDPDGAGAASPLLVVGGSFARAGGVWASNLAACNPTSESWANIGNADGPVLSFATLASGELAVGGRFLSVGGLPANRIARWNGTSWSAFANGLSHAPRQMAVMPNGVLMIVDDWQGDFGRLQRWDGASWSIVDMPFYAAGALHVDANGHLLVTGRTSDWSGGVARWDGANWTMQGQIDFREPSFLITLRMKAVTTMPNGSVVVAGTFSSYGSTSLGDIAVWDGTSWSALGSRRHVNDLERTPSGQLFAAGQPGAGFGSVAYWDGTGWRELPLVNEALSLCFGPGGDLFCGHQLHSLGYVARYVAGEWRGVGDGTSGPPNSLAVLPDGRVLAAGGFHKIGGVQTGGVALWNGSTWLAIAGGPPIPMRGAVGRDGLVFVGDYSGNVRTWDGQSWQQLGGPIGNGPVIALAVLDDGRPVASDYDTTYVFDGLGWVPTGPSHYRLAALSGNRIVGVGGGYDVEVFDGTTWTQLGRFDDIVYAVVEAADGSLYAAGGFSTVSGVSAAWVARWHGGAWSAVPGLNGSVTALAALPGGDLVAGGDFTQAGVDAVQGLARWQGRAWRSYGQDLINGVATHFAFVGVRAELTIAGAFTGPPGAVVPHLVRSVSDCPARVSDAGGGCAGTNGLDLLTATTMPWAGAAMRSRATGLPVSGRGIAIYGVMATQVALPMAFSGCDLLVVPVVVLTADPIAGVAEASVVLPVDPNLVGVDLQHQVVSLDLAAGLLSASNRLELTIGVF